MRNLIKNTLEATGIIVLLAFGIIAANLVTPLVNQAMTPVGLGGYKPGEVNSFGSLTTISTTTVNSYDCTMCPVKLLSIDRENDRRYVIITNSGKLNSTDVYLYATTSALSYNFNGSVTDSSLRATSTILSLNGILISPSSTYTILPENMVYGELWASSTAAQQIDISYYEHP